MLKCPRCGARVKGPDLLTGVCSACQQRLTDSVSGSIDMEDGGATFVSSDAPDSAPEGDSLADVGSVGSQVSDADVLSDNLGGSYDLGLTPAAAADGLSDRDTAESLDSAEGSASESAATFISDQWVDAPTPVPPFREPDASESAASATLSGEEDAGRTFVSDEIEPVDPEAHLRTMGSPADLEEAAADRTFVSDVPDSPILRTLEAVPSRGERDESDKTFVSDDVPEALVRTLQSHYGDEAAEPATRTIKGREAERIKSPKSTLVIKTRLLRDMQVVPAGRSADPEYELVKVLGEGGMGVVYDARQTSIDRQVALKMIKGAAAKSEKQQAKFLAEAVVTGDLDHPNIVPIYDVGRNEAGALFYSMKKVQGTPWDEVLHEKTLAENIDILMRVADAVAFAHSRGVVHRDLKPENTMLGEFGEVLVMDWGLAQPSKRFRKSSSITETSSMGGTPAYMAPEMATGPLEKISHLSDVYLLGAILYEILTGKPPHMGKNAMKCLMAAARNEITPTDKTGELIDIALKAMATEPMDRYQDVRSLQGAIREYQSHSESILLSTRAEDDLAEAEQSDDYSGYAKALFGFQEAYDLWNGNARARSGVHQAQYAYAESARRKGDFDLGLSLLNDTVLKHQPLKQKILAEKQEREARKTRLAALRKMAIGLVGVVFATVTVAFFWISYEADKARKAERVAVTEKEKADIARGEAEVSEQRALDSLKLAEVRRQQAEQAQQLEAKAKQEAIASFNLAEEKRKEAEEARRLEEQAKRKEEYEAYIAEIGLAAAKINENAFESARQLLAGCKPELRNWEWGRLMHLCSQSMRSLPAKAPLDTMALAPDGIHCATGGWDGVARLWNVHSGELLKELRHGGLYVHSVAFSPDGRLLATGSDDPAGFVQLWDVMTGERLGVFAGHEDAVLSVSFSHDGSRLVSASYDKTARVWNVASRQEEQVLNGHTWWVWQAVFSPDDSRIATAGQDGTALVWDATTGQKSPAFTAHNGPVYALAFVNQGREIVSGGYDRRLLLWSPDSLKPYDFRKLEQGEPVKVAADYRELGAHTTSIRCLTVSNDGALLVTGSQDNTVRLWNLTDQTLVQTFRGHDSWIRGVAFGNDGRTVISASQDATVRTWSLADYAELRAIQGRELDGHSDAVLAAAFSPDQKQVVTASRDRTARTWDAATGASQQTFVEGHAFLASTARFFDHGRKLATSAVDNTTRLWDVATGTEILRMDHTGRAAALAIAPHERWLATGGDRKQVQLWEVGTGKRLREFQGHIAEVTAVAFDPTGERLISGDAKGHVIVWNAQDGSILHQLDGHSRRINRIIVTPNGERVLTASNDNTVGAWDLTTGKELTSQILKHPDGVVTMALHGDGQTLVTSCADRQLRVWDLAKNSVTHTFGPWDEIIHSLSLSNDGRRLLTTHSEEKAVRQWDLETATEVRAPGKAGDLGPLLDLRRTGGLLWAAQYAPGDEILTVGGSDARLWDLKSRRERISFSPHAAVASAGFSPDGRWIVTGSWDNSARIWNAATAHAVVKLEGAHNGFVNSAVFSPDGKFVLTASDDGTARLWSVTLPAEGEKVTPSAQVARVFEGHEDRVRFAMFSPQGDRIVTTSDDKSVRLWDVANGQLLRTLNGHEWSVLAADFSHDGRRLVTGSEDNLAKVWNVENGECELTLAGHTAPVASVAFSPDGTRLITGSRDQVAKLWDTRTGKEILTLNRHTDDITSVSFSPDGRQILTSSRDGTAVIWPTMDWAAPRKPDPVASVSSTP